jgi:hypothetical protein
VNCLIDVLPAFDNPRAVGTMGVVATLARAWFGGEAHGLATVATGMKPAVGIPMLPTLAEITWPSGKWVFVAALVLLLVWLALMPRKLIGQAERVPPWWRNVRVWAIVVCAIQVVVYAYFA